MADGAYIDKHGDKSVEEIEKLNEKLAAFVQKHELEAKRRVDRRKSTEERWFLDLRQYHGVHTKDTEARINELKGSKAYINKTRAKTNAIAARLYDLLFPTDERNWTITPTPVPELTDQAEAALQLIDEARQEEERIARAQEEAGASADPMAAQQAQENIKALQQGVVSPAQEAADELQEQLEAANRSAELMQAEIDDQLKASNYSAESRDQIDDATKLGTGVLKGPVLGGSPKRKWSQVAEAKMEDGQNVSAAIYALKETKQTKPGVYRCDVWGFFPDPDVKKVDEGNGVYERHLMNARQMRVLARRPDILKDNMRVILEEKPRRAAPSYLGHLNDITGENTVGILESYQVWEYTGPIDHKDLKLLDEAYSEPGEYLSDDDYDVLDELHVRMWFCQGKVLAFGIHPLDSGAPIYSVYNLEKDEAGPWGFGIPYLMRHEQSIRNGAVRMMMDNAGLAGGPQIVVDQKAVRPQNKVWEFRPLKIWWKNTDDAAPNAKPFEAVTVPMVQQELANIIAMADQDIDVVTSTPAIAQGEQGAGVTKTAQGMALLMNSANVVFRRWVKNWDDDVTVPLIQRFYDWNMQFSKKEHIKGDYGVVARGSSVLLVREMQAQNLLMIAQMFGDHPEYGPMLKKGGLLRHIFRAHMLPTDDVLLSEREYKDWQEDQKNSPSPEEQAAQAQAEAAQKMAAAKEDENNIRREELAAKKEMNDFEWATRKEIAEMDYNATMEKVAAALNMKTDELRARIDGERMKATDRSEAERIKSEGQDRRLAAEITMKERHGESAGGAI